MTFEIPQAQQLVFIEHFMKQVLDLSLEMAAQGEDKGSPGETIFTVAKAVIRQLYTMETPSPEDLQ